MVTFDKIYNSLPLPSMNDVKIKQTQNTNDLVEAIKNSHIENLKYAKKIAPMFRGVNNFQTGSNIFNFLKTYIPYHVEPAARQTTRTLPRMLHDAAGGVGSDCKHYSVFTGTILESLKIPFKYRLAAYNTEYPQHIYTVIFEGKKEIIVDAVLSNYNTEKKPLKKYDMSLYKLSGVEIGTANRSKNKRLAKKIKETTKTISLAIPRNAFLLLTNFNVFGLATKLDKILKFSGDNGLKFWVQFGGKLTKLKEAIEKGSKKKPIATIHGVEDLQGIGVAGELAASFAAALPIIIKVIELFKNMKVGTDGMEKATAEAKQDFEQQTGTKLENTVFKQDSESGNTNTVLTKSDAKQTTEADADKIAAAKGGETTSGKTFGIDNKYLLLGGAGLLGYMILKKNK